MKKLTKYELLTQELIGAKKAALALGRTEDGGTCNLDSLQIKLPGWNESKAVDAIKTAGLTGYKTSFWGTSVYLIIPPASGQANDRTRKAEAMKKAMPDEYNPSVWYQMD